jgi:hypothetical protein
MFSAMTPPKFADSVPARLIDAHKINVAVQSDKKAFQILGASGVCRTATAIKKLPGALERAGAGRINGGD